MTHVGAIGTRAGVMLVALLATMALAAPSRAGTASFVFPGLSVQGEGETIGLATALGVNPAVRVHAPDQPAGCPGLDRDPGATIPGWPHSELTGVQYGEIVGSWQPWEAGTYDFCAYFADASFVEVERQVVPPLTYTLTATAGPPGAPTAVALDGALAAAIGHPIAIELKYRTAGGLPCSPSPALEPGTVIADPAATGVHFWLIEPGAAGLTVTIRAETAPLAAGTYLLCMWEGAGGPDSDASYLSVVTSTTFVVAAPVAAASTAPAPPVRAAAAPASPAHAVPRSVARPTLTGRFRVGSRVRCGTGAWTSPPAVSGYRWYRGARRIAGASSATYRVVRRDAGSRLRCQAVVASGTRRLVSALSAPRAVATR